MYELEKEDNSKLNISMDEKLEEQKIQGESMYMQELQKIKEEQIALQ
jgi:hypothetical protein